MPDFDFSPGWHDLPDEVARIQALQPIGVFEDTEAANQDDPLPDYVNQHDAAIKVTGSFLPVRNQSTAGTCEGFGNIRAVELAMLCGIAAGENWIWDNAGLAIEPAYGYSRVEVGKRRLGRGDGSIGAWMAQALKELGVTFRKNFPEFKIDLSQYSIPLARDWGWNGVPDAFEPVLRQHVVKGVAKITTLDGLKRALAGRKGVAQGSSWLLERNRDSRGYIGAYRGGGHCQGVPGYIKENGETRYSIDNQWGKYHGGPVHPKFPCPAGGLVAEAVMQGMIDAGDIWAFSGDADFAKVGYDWGGIG